MWGAGDPCIPPQAAAYATIGEEVVRTPGDFRAARSDAWGQMGWVVNKLVSFVSKIGTLPILGRLSRV